MKEDLTGRRFGHWVVLGIGERSQSGRFRWRCKCEEVVLRLFNNIIPADIAEKLGIEPKEG